MHTRSTTGKSAATLSRPGRCPRPPEPLTPAEADRIYRAQRRTFLDALATHLDDAGVKGRLFRRGTRLAWREPHGRMNEATVRLYSSPAHHTGAPLVLRAVVGGDSQMIPSAVFEDLDIADGRRRDDVHWRELELSTLPDEFMAFAPWLAAWIVVRQSWHDGAVSDEMREEMRQILDAPPFTFERVLGDVARSNYLWTRTAAAVHDAWYARYQARKMRGRTMTSQVAMN